MNPKEQIIKLLKQCDIEVNGSRDFDIQVKDERLYSKVLAEGSLGAGEAYMDGWWDVKALDQFFCKMFESDAVRKFYTSLPAMISIIKAKMFNMQSSSRSFQVGEKHYDIGNDIYKAMLGKSMAYSCGYWSPPLAGSCSERKKMTLDDAQFAKYDLICRKIGLKSGQKILDIGCGWGGFLKYAAENYGAKGMGITISKEQAEFARETLKGLDIEILLQDYRLLTGKFDHVISIGMFEHVGYKNYGFFMKRVSELLNDDGLFLLHTIGTNESTASGDPWMEKYIFPNGMLPSVSQIGKSVERIFVMEDWHNFGAYYDKTLMAWFENFNNNWNFLKHNYSERFYRMWKFYLLSCAGMFRAREVGLWQIVFSKRGVKGGYNSMR